MDNIVENVFLFLFNCIFMLQAYVVVHKKANIEKHF